MSVNTHNLPTEFTLELEMKENGLNKFFTQIFKCIEKVDEKLQQKS
jgi:hypothetical protein